MSLIRATDPETAAQLAAAELAADVEAALAARGAAHIAVSGGRTPRRAYELLGPLVGSWNGVHVWFADERAVGPDDPESNALLVRETLVAPGAVVHRVRGELGGDEAAAAYSRELAEVVLDTVLLGLGEDGHTASLFPGNPALAPSRDRAVAVHDAPKPPPDRISLALETLNGARRRLLLVTGADKAAALEAAAGEPSQATPASLLARDGLDVIADRAALGDEA